MGTRQRPSRRWITTGSILNLVILCVPILMLSSLLMEVASSFLGERVDWPQISFMSAYPRDVRNGYLLFVTAVFINVLLSSGFFASVAGASFGKAILGICYVRAGTDELASIARMMFRAGLLLALLTPILLLGPVLGFVFGAKADDLSILSLIFGIGFLVWAYSLDSVGTNALDRWAGVEPALRIWAADP